MQEALQHGIDVASSEHFLASADQPIACVLVSMLPDDIGRILHVAIRRMSQTPLDISPRKVNDGAELVDGFERLEPEIAES